MKKRMKKKIEKRVEHAKRIQAFHVAIVKAIKEHCIDLEVGIPANALGDFVWDMIQALEDAHEETRRRQGKAIRQYIKEVMD